MNSMECEIKIIQLRSTIFISQNIGYVPKVANVLKVKLMPEGEIKGLIPNGIPATFDNSPVQWGSPWRIIEKDENGLQYEIHFLPNKIDILQNDSVDSNEEEFIRKSVDWFKTITDFLQEKTVFRLAYAPSYSFEPEDITTFWKKFIKVSSYEGITGQDINLSFLFKKEIDVGEQKIVLNLLHRLSDAIKTTTVDGTPNEKRVIMVQMDLNTVPIPNLKIKEEDMVSFFNCILEIKNNLIQNLSYE
jgi:hypothetical protein